MNQIEKLRNRLAAATPAEAQTIRELIETLEADDEPTTTTTAPACAIALTAAQKDNPFLNPRARWVPADDRTREWLKTFEEKK